MGLFFNYSKPGPGVSKNEPKKKGVDLYFELFFRHFWDFIKENMLYVTASIPMFLIYYVLFTVFLDSLGMQQFAMQNNILASYETIKIISTILLVILCGSGPASAGLAYMMRCITREEHCFLWSDFWEKFKENFKYGMIIVLIDVLILTIIAPLSIKFYHMQYSSTDNSIWLMAMFIVIIMLFIYIMMHMYFYQFIITFELKFFVAVKNSFIMTMAFLPLNLLVFAIPVVLMYFLLSHFTPVAVLLFSVLFLVSFLRYPIEFLASRLILKKVMVKKEEDDIENK